MEDRKIDKLRPYRVDYFNVGEMKHGKVLVRSMLVRAITSIEAKNEVLGIASPIPGRLIIRAYRFYGRLKKESKHPKYTSLSNLFSATKIDKILNQMEEYCSQEVPPPTTGPDSPETQTVVQDMNGMLSHDQHEQMMDTFVPDSELQDQLAQETMASEGCPQVHEEVPAQEIPPVSPIPPVPANPYFAETEAKDSNFGPVEFVILITIGVVLLFFIVYFELFH